LITYLLLLVPFEVLFDIFHEKRLY
jgi:hypothetical protein